MPHTKRGNRSLHYKSRVVVEEIRLPKRVRQPLSIFEQKNAATLDFRRIRVAIGIIAILAMLQYEYMVGHIVGDLDQ